MLRLSYVSRSQLPEAEQNAIIQEIVSVAQARNSREGITGILLSTGRSFAQVLEGNEEAVLKLIADITGDRAHRDVQLILREQVRERGYGEWSMAYWGGGSYAQRLIEGVYRDRSSPRDRVMSVNALLAFMAKCAGTDDVRAGLAPP